MSPALGQNQVDAQGVVSRDSIAKRILESHRKGLDSRRERDLISEKLMLHIDGSGDLQWVDIMQGVRVEIPRLVSEYRKQENILRLVTDNAVAHHTTMPLHYSAKSSPDREAKERALVDTLWMNHLAYEQDFNGTFAKAMRLAMATGFVPVHAYWREGVDDDWFEPLVPGEEERTGLPRAQGVSQGMIDLWVGNPFTTVFDRNAGEDAAHWCSYGRILPADRVRRHFGHIPGVSGLQGTTKLPSTSEFQMVASNWRSLGIGLHGSPVLEQRRDEGDEMLSIICYEEAPGQNYEHGRLQIIAVPGEIDTGTGRSRGGGGHAILLADQPLPGKSYSWVNFYSHHRVGDIHGKPWAEDIDQLQVDLNIALSKRWEVINRMVEAPIVTPGGAISEDMADIGGYNLLEVEPSAANWRPRVMEWPQSILIALDNEVSEKRRAMFTAGGYQASSRGEAPGSRMAYRAILALQQADNTVHGPVNQRFQHSAVAVARMCWKQMKEYGAVPWLVSMLDGEQSHLAQSYIDNTQLSERAPRYKLVNAFGPSPELRAQEILELMNTMGADGEPFLTTREARRQYPNQGIFNDPGDPTAVQVLRAKAVARAIHDTAAAFREQTGMDETAPDHPWVQQAAQQVFEVIERRFGRKRDDLLEAHLMTLTEITQDESADPIARAAAALRQDLYYQWQAMMAMGQGSAPGTEITPEAEQAAQGRPDGPSDIDPRSVAAAMRGRERGTTLDQEEQRP